MDALAYMFSIARKDSSNELEFKPEWIMQEDLMSLSSKFPFIPGSQRSITFCTTPLSQKLREMPSDADFDLTVPCSPPPRYNELHDPHLKEYFQNPVIRKRLVEQGYVTPRGFVKCTLLEFNMFRQWIRKLKLDRIHQERRRERQIEKQQWKERQARERLLRDEELYSIVREREQKARELKERGRKRREADRRRYQKLQDIDRKRREEHEQDMKRTKDINESQREMNLEKKQAQKVEEEEKTKKIKIRLLAKRGSEDKHRENMLKKRRQTLIQEKEKKLKESWKRRCSLSLERQEEKRKQEEAEREEHVRNVARRTSIVAKQRRKSQVYRDLCLQRVRNTLEKQHQEAENFLERMREKKMRDLELWKQKHARMREKHLQERRVSFPRKSSVDGPEHRRRSRLSSVWDLQSSLKSEFGIDDNVVYSSVVFAGRKPTRGERMDTIAEEEASRQLEEVDQFEKLLSRLEAEFALREQVHHVVFGLIQNAQIHLDVEEMLEIAKGVPSYVQGILDAAQIILADRQTGDVRSRARKYILRVINNAASSAVDSGLLPSSDDQTRRAIQQIVTTAVTRAKEEVQRRISLRDTAKDIVTAAISSASQKALAYAAQEISENLSECAKEIVTTAIVSALRQGKDDREVIAARSLAVDATQAAKASLERLYGVKLKLTEKEQVDTQEISTNLDRCAKEVAIAAIVSATRSLEKAITKNDCDAIAARSLAVDAVAAAKASLEKLHGLNVDLEDKERYPSVEISKCLAKSARDIAEAVILPSKRLLETSSRNDHVEILTAQSLASDAIQAAKTSLENLYGIKDDSKDDDEQPAKEIAATAILSATETLGEESKRTDVDLVLAARTLASSVVESAKASIMLLYDTKVAPEAKEDAQKMFLNLEEAAKNIADVAIDLATRSLERMSEKNEWDLTSTTRKLINDVLDSAKASLEMLHGITIESEEELSLTSFQETSVISSTRDSFESLLSMKECEEDLKVAARRLVSDALKSTNASRKRLYCVANDMEANIKSTALEISKSLVDSSKHLPQQLEKEGLGTAARYLACSAIESAAKSISKLFEDETSVQDIVRSDSRLLHAAGKVATISARASLGELFDRGFIGGVELEEATGYLATHALISAESMLEKVQDTTTTVDLDLEICKAASELASHAVVSTEGSVARLMQPDQPNSSERGSDQGTLFWKVTTYVESLINGALRQLGSTGFNDDASESPEQYVVVTHEQAFIADAEYGPQEEDLYQREILALKASRIVNDVMENAMDFLRAQRKDNSSLSVADVRPGNAKFTRRRSSSVHFKEGSLFHSRRDSVVRRPPTPRFRKDRAGSVVSQEIQELKKEQVFSLDDDSELVQQRSSDPGPGIVPEDVSHSEPERSASDSKINIEDEGTSLTEKVSLYEVIKSREGTASCEISPCGSYVVLPHLNPSECSLITARVESYEALWNQNTKTSSVTSLPSLSPKGSFVASEAVEQVCQYKEPQNRSLPASSRLPDIARSTSKIPKESSSGGSLKLSSEHPKRTSSLQLKKTTPKSSPKSSKASGKFPSKSSTEINLQSPRNSLGKVTVSLRDSLREQDGSQSSSSRRMSAASTEASTKDLHQSQKVSTSKNIFSPRSSLKRASLSPRTSSEKAALTKPKSSQNLLRSSPQTSTLYGRPSMDKTDDPSGPSLDKTAASACGSVDKMALNTRVSSNAQANLSLRVSKGKVTPSPRVSRQKVVPSPKTSTENVTRSPRASTENVAVSPSVSKENDTQASRASTEKVALSPRVSKGHVIPSPRSSAENATLSPCISKGKVTHSPRASTENVALSPRVSKRKVTHSPRGSTQNAASSSRVSKGKIMQSPRPSTEEMALSASVSKSTVTDCSRVSAKKIAVSSQSSHEKVSLSSSAGIEKATESSPMTEKVLSDVNILTDTETLPNSAAVTKTVSYENAVAVLQKASKSVAITQSVESGTVDSQEAIKKTEPTEKTKEAAEDTNCSGEKLAMDPTSLTKNVEKASDLEEGQFQGNDIVEKSLASMEGAPLTSDFSQMQGVGSDRDQPDVNKDEADGDLSETKEVSKKLKNIVPSLERIIQDKRLTPEGAEGETRPASSADVLASRKYTGHENIFPVKSDPSWNVKASDGLRASLSKSLSSTADSKVGGNPSGQGFSRCSQEMLVSKASGEEKVIATRKKPEGEDRSEVKGVPLGDEKVSSELKVEKKDSSSRMPDDPVTKQQSITSLRNVKEIDSYQSYRAVSVSRSIHDTVDDMVQRMLSTADEPSAIEVSRPSGRGSRGEMKRDSETSLDAPRGFGRERRLSTGKVSNTVIETVDLMLQSVSSSDERRVRQSSVRKLSGSDIQTGYDIPRTASSMERFSWSTPSAQGISCVYELTPSPPKLPSPKRSRLRATPSQESAEIRATQSDSSIVSSSSDKAADLKPKVSGAWLDGTVVKDGEASVRSQSPKRPHSSPTPSLHRRSSGRLSTRHSLDGVSMETNTAVAKAT